MTSRYNNLRESFESHSALAPLAHITVSDPFRRATFVHFPQLADNIPYQTFFWYLLFGGRHDENTHRLLLCADVLSAIEGRSPQNSRAKVFLEKFRTEVLVLNGCNIQWSGWYKKKCRQLRCLKMGNFQDILQREHQGEWDLDGRVYLDGTRFNPKKQRRLRLEHQTAANRLPALCDDAKNIRAYLNALPPNLFTALLNRNFQGAMNAALQIKGDVGDAQRRILRHIKSQPQPFYFPSVKGNTVRLSTSESIPNLKSSIRHELTKGWIDADLRCSQLAICGHLWGIKEVTDFLEMGVSVWAFLCDSISLPPEKQATAKPIIKKSLYSICYGMDEKSVKGLAALRFIIGGLDKAYAGRLLEVPMVKAILEARRTRLAEVEQQGGAENGYGVWRPISGERGARDILAEISQSWEMRLVTPAFTLARSTNEFIIGLFQHDGFSVHFSKQTDTQRVERWKLKVQEAIERQSKTLGIPTKLEWQAKETKVTSKERAASREPFVSTYNSTHDRKTSVRCQKPSSAELSENNSNELFCNSPSAEEPYALPF